MFLLDHISEKEYLEAISEDIEIAKNINLYDVDAKHLAEHVRQEVISRYGLRAYKDCLLYTSPSPRDCDRSRMPSSA